MMKHMLVATVLALCAGASFAKEASPACAALQSAKSAAASGKAFEPYRLVTSDGEQVVSTPEQAIAIWTPLCPTQAPRSAAKVKGAGKAVAQKNGQATSAEGV